VLAATERTQHTVTELIPLTCNEIRHLFVSMLNGARHDLDHLLRWSRWRRQNQARARASHYHRRQAPPP